MAVYIQIVGIYDVRTESYLRMRKIEEIYILKSYKIVLGWLSGYSPILLNRVALGGCMKTLHIYQNELYLIF